MRYLFILLLFAALCTTRGFSQIVIEDGIDEDSEQVELSSSFQDSTHITRILLIPFEKSMYTSDADREIMSASKINYVQLVYKFRVALMIMLKNKISTYYETKNLIEDPVKDSVNYLGKLYQSIGYKSVNYNTYRRNKENSPDKNISKGQLSVRESSGEKRTKVVVINKAILDFINSELGSDMFVFISMFEIKNDLSDYAEVGTNNYKRTLKVHFNIINSRGKDMGGDIARVTFSSKINKIDEIIKKTFPDICDQILMKTPQPKIIKKENISETK
jgi:hypothetical protein